MNRLVVDGSTHYEFFDTADGSPSICMSSELYRPEAMHHREGALAESLFVYDGVLRESLDLGCPPKILSVGLGCAYNEIIAVAHALSVEESNPHIFENFYLESFEGDRNLRESFYTWLTAHPPGQPIDPQLNSELTQTYERILASVALHFSISPESLKQKMKSLAESEQLRFREWLTADTVFAESFGVIFFDAFSGKSTPLLWSEEFLESFLIKTSGPNCGLATYAATGTLKRALKRTGFSLRDQKGFAFKRQSTRAFRLSVKSIALPTPNTL